MGDEILNDSGMSELHVAAYHGELDWVQNCIKGGLDVNACDNDGFTPLHWVAHMGMVGPCNGEREDIVQLLIDMGANVNSIDNAGESVFFRAVMAGNYKIVRILIDAKENVDATNCQGDRPLDIAIANEDFELVEIIKHAVIKQQIE